MIRGAEADVAPATWLGREVLAKQRVTKRYRHHALDARLRDERTRDEAKLLAAARAAGVPVPIVYDADRPGATITMQTIEGIALRDGLAEGSDEQAEAWMQELGRVVARLHKGGLVHGDLTTSNVLVSPTGLQLIDFGLGAFSVEDEDRAVDLHLVEEALQATDDRASVLVSAFLDVYASSYGEAADAVLRRLEAVRERGRYRGT